MRIYRVLAFLCLFAGLASAQSTTVIGTFRAGDGVTAISSGQVAATLTPGIDTLGSGTARFSPTEVDCTINGANVAASQAVRTTNSVTISGLTGHTFITTDLIQVAGMTDSTFNGTFTITSTTATSITYSQTAANSTSGGGTVSALRAISGSGACTVATNTLVQPANTSWKFCVQPGFIQPGSCFIAYALGGTLDVSAQPATPSLTPAYNLVDTFSTQTISGSKTFSGTVTFGGTLNLGAISLGGALTATNGGTLGGTFTGSPTFTSSLSAFGPTTSAQLLGVISDETGTGLVMGNNAPAIISPTTTGTDSGAETLGGKIINPAGLGFAGTSGTTTVKASATASGALTLPAATGTLAIGNFAFQKFVANGTFTIPPGVTGVRVTLFGGGAGGGGATATNVGAGGGSGGYAIKYLSGLTPGNTITVTVGAGGTGVSGAAGNSGAASTIASGTQAITTVTANGGIGGGSQSAVPIGGGGAAAISTNGDINGAGVPGDTGFSTAAGVKGGSTMLGGAGNVVGGSTAGTSAVANTGSGGGGAGAGATNAGGNGAAGMVLFEWVQ